MGTRKNKRKLSTAQPAVSASASNSGSVSGNGGARYNKNYLRRLSEEYANESFDEQSAWESVNAGYGGAKKGTYNDRLRSLGRSSTALSRLESYYTKYKPLFSNNDYNSFREIYGAAQERNESFSQLLRDVNKSAKSDEEFQNIFTDISYRDLYSGTSYADRKKDISDLEKEYERKMEEGDEEGALSSKEQLDWLRKNTYSFLKDTAEFDAEIEAAENLIRKLEVSDGVYDASQYINGVYIGNYSDERKAAERELSILKTAREQKEAEERLNERSAKVSRDYAVLASAMPNVNPLSLQREFLNPTKEELDAYEYRMNPAGWYVDYDGNTYNAMGERVYTDDGEFSFSEPKIQDKLGLYLSTSKEEREAALSAGDTTWAMLIREAGANSWDQLTEDEINTYYRLLKYRGQETADQFLQDMTTELNRREVQKKNEEFAARYAESSDFEKRLMSMASVPANVFGGAIAGLDDLGHIIRGESINPYSSSHAMQDYGQNVRSYTSEYLDEASGNKAFLGMTMGDAYSSLMSSADSIAGAFLLGGTGYGLTMGLGAASSEAKRLYEQGANDTQIAIGGILAGVAEGVFEKYSIEKFLNIGDAATWKELIKNVAKQGLAEGSEELFTELANTITNAIVMGRNSGFMQDIANYEMEGKSKSEATALAVVDVAKEMWQAGLGGALSGMFMGGVGATQGAYNIAEKNAQENAQYKEQYGDSLEALVQEALELDHNNALAQKIQQKISEGKQKDVQGGDIKKLLTQNEKAIEKQENEADELSVDEYSSILEAAQNELEGGENTGSEITLPERETDAGAAVEIPAAERTDVLTEDEGETRGKAIITSTGALADIVGVSSNENGVMMLKLSSGEKVNAKEVSYKNADDALIYEMIASSDMSAEEANRILSTYENSGVSASDFVKGIEETYRYGRYNYSVDKLASDGEYAHKLTGEQRVTAYRAGQRDAGRQVAKDTAKARQGTKKAATEGGVRYHTRYLAANVNTEVVSLLNKVKAGQAKPSDKVYFEDVSDETAEKIHQLTGVDVRGFKVAVEARQLEHILKMHGENGISNHSMADDTDVGRIEYALKNYTDLRPAGRAKSYTNMVNGHNRTAQTVLYEADVGEKAYYVVQAVPDTKARTLFVVSAFIGEKGYKKEALQSANAKIPGVTAKTATASASTNKVSQEEPGVNRKNQARGTIHYRVGEKADIKGLNSQQREGLRAAELISRLTGAEVYIFESYKKGNKRYFTDEDGVEHEAANGWYDPNDGSIHIDLNAGRSDIYGNTRGTVLFTLSHELMHFIRDWSPNKFKTLSNFIVKQYEKSGYNVDKLVSFKMKDLGLTYDAAFEEVMADSMEDMLSSGEAIRMLKEIKEQDGGLWDKIKEFFRNFMEKLQGIIDAYKDVKPDSAEGLLFSHLTDTKSELEKLFAEALSDASVNIQGNKKTAAEGGVKYQIREYNSSKEQLSQNVFALANMDIVQNVPAGKLERTGKRPTDIFAEYFDSWGNNIYSEELGDIALKKSSIKSEIRHGITAEKIASIEAIPNVLQKGKVIFAETKSGADVQRIVVCAPIKIGEVPYYMGVMLQRDTQNQRLYLHNVAIEKEATEISQADLLTTGADESNEHLFITNILRNALAVKYQEKDKIRSQRRNAVNNDVISALEAENEKLKEDVQDLKELLKLQKQVTGGTRFTKSSLDALAGHIMRDADAKGDKAEFTELLKTVYEYIAQNDDVTWEGVSERIDPAVKWLQDNKKPSKSILDPYSKLVLREIRDSRVYLTDAQKEEADYLYGSFNEFRKKMMGSITIANDAKLSLDERWAELSKEFPNTFPSDIPDTDMPRALEGIIKSLRETKAYVIEYGYDWEMTAQELKTQIYDGYWRVSTLYTVADRYQKKIDKLKAQHGNKMADLKDRHRETVKDLKGKYDARLRELKAESKEKAEKREQEIIKKYRESREKAKESRDKTAMRHKVKTVVSELNKYLLKGTKETHVPIELQLPVAMALDAVNMDTVDAEARIEALEEQLSKTKNAKKREEIESRIENVRKMGDKLKDRLEKLKIAYDSIKNDTDPLVANAYDDVISMKIESVNENVGDTPLKNMTISQLEEVYDLYTMVLWKVRDANKAFKKQKYEEISELGTHIMEEVVKAGGVKEEMNGLYKKLDTFMWNNLKPVYAFERIGSETMTGLWSAVREGEDTWAVDISEAKVFANKTKEKYGYDKWDFTKRYPFVSDTGIKFTLSLDQMLSLYAYSKRAQADEHLEKGGFVFDSNIEVVKKEKGMPVKYTINTAKTHRLSKKTLFEIAEKLKPEQRHFADEMQDYLSSVMGEKGNEASLKMYGVKLFKEKNYFPLKSAKQFLFEQNENAGEVKLKNSGFTKETKPQARNPIVLSNFMDVWAGHVNSMSLYHSFVLSVEDFNRVFNYSKPYDENTDNEGVKTAIQNAYGVQANNYISQLIKDVNGGVRSDPTESAMRKWISRHKKAAVLASASVVIQQPSAIGRALAIIPEKYFVFSKELVHPVKTWEEVKKYAPVAVIKEMGRFDTDTGMSTARYLKGPSTKIEAVMQKADDVLGIPAQKADELTWNYIWVAVKRETQAKNKAKGINLDVTTEEFLKQCGERFTEVIVKTQVYDSVMSKSANMRSKSGLAIMATSFMAEPTTTINMVEDAIRKGIKGYKKTALKTLKGAVCSIVLNSILVSFIYAMRDDEEDETYLEKYFGSLISELTEGFNPLTYLPFVKDVWSLMQGYDIERTDMAVFADLIKSYSKLRNVITKDTSEMDDGELTEYKNERTAAWLNLGADFADTFGIPVGNIKREIEGAVNFIKTLGNDLDNNTGSFLDELQESFYMTLPEFIRPEVKSKSDKLYEAVIEGDEAYRTRVEASFKSESAVQSALKKGLQENDPRVKAAAEARFNGDAAEYARIFGEILDEGLFTQEIIQNAIDAEENKLKPDRESEDNEQIESIFKIGDYYYTIQKDDLTTADIIRDDMIRVMVAKGESEKDAEKSFNSSFVSEVKSRYMDGTIEKTEAVDYMAEFGGKTRAEAETEIKKCDFELQYGYSWSSRDNAYRLGDITMDELIKHTAEIEGAVSGTAKLLYLDGDIRYDKAVTMLKEYDDLSPLKAEQAVKKWDFEVEYGYSYDNRGEGYKNGDISESELKTAIMDIADASEEEAQLQIKVYDWEKANPEYDLDQSTIKAYIKPIEKMGGTTLENIGMDAKQFEDYRNKASECKGTDADGDGNADRGTIQAEVFALINSYPISTTAKDALFYLHDSNWAESALYKAPWH